MIELRSDTFTLPSREMLESILETKLGDNVYNEDTAKKVIFSYMKLAGRLEVVVLFMNQLQQMKKVKWI
ncbi:MULTISPECIES: beta-eliminating lyase-related protein [Clostridia]|uniref:beta-eliminating lyase-related protein n=1 Tax=Clostridia TaxID=186801 RepID=UPI0018F785D3